MNCPKRAGSNNCQLQKIETIQKIWTDKRNDFLVIQENKIIKKIVNLQIQAEIMFQAQNT